MKNAPAISVERSAVAAAPREKITAKEIDPSKYGLKPFDTLFDELDEDEPVHSPSVTHAKEMMRRGEELRAKSSQARAQKKKEFVLNLLIRNATFDWKRRNNLKASRWTIWSES